MAHILEKYIKEVSPVLQKRFGYKNKMALPKIEKVVVNTGFGRVISGKRSEEQKKIIQNIFHDLSLICGQKPKLAVAKKSISGFKIRNGMPLGAVVTLRGKRMYDFIERLIHVALPRSRDFQGISQKAFDKTGNLTIGIKEQTIFPEIMPGQTRLSFGFEVIINLKTKNKEEGIELLKLLGFPIK